MKDYHNELKLSSRLSKDAKMKVESGAQVVRVLSTPPALKALVNH